MHPKSDPENLSVKFGLSRKLLIVAAVLVALTGIITQYRNNESRLAARWVVHTRDVIETAHVFLSNLVAAEMTHTYRLLTNDPNAQRAYLAATNQIDTSLDQLRILIIDNTVQTAMIDQHITPLIKSQRALWENEFKLAGVGSDKTIPHSQNENQRLVSDSINFYASRFIANEKTLLISRNEQLQKNYFLQDTLRIAFLVVIGITCLAAFFTIRTQERINSILVQSLEAANSGLEQKVKSRTEELESSNAELSESLEEIRSLQQSLEVRNQRLEESLAEINFLYDHAPCGYHTIDSNGFIIKINKTELDWIGYSEDEVVGKKLASDFLTPESAERRNKLISDLKKVGQLENLEFDFLRRDGSTFPVLLNTVAYYDQKNKYTSNRSSVFDITLRKKLEKDVQETNSYLVRLNEEKNRFLRIATHDLKTPLSGIYGLVQLLKFPNQSKQAKEEYMDLIEASILKMNGLIEKFLDINRIEQAGSILNEKIISLEEFMTRLASNFSTLAKKKNIEFVLENRVGKIDFKTDPELLEQVLDNLISNAIKFSPFNKKVWFRTERTENNQLAFEVEDQGPGIKPDEIPKLFVTFQRLSAKPTAGESSTGVGLSIVKGMVQTLNGEIKVSSEEGRGASFKVILNLNAS